MTTSVFVGFLVCLFIKKEIYVIESQGHTAQSCPHISSLLAQDVSKFVCLLLPS